VRRLSQKLWLFELNGKCSSIHHYGVTGTLWGNRNCTAICLHSAYTEAGKVALAM
jgi:hypothetical protein